MGNHVRGRKSYHENFFIFQKKLFLIGLTKITNCWLQIFSINIKGIAGSLVTLVSWFGSWLMTYAFNFLMSWSPSGKILLLTCHLR